MNPKQVINFLKTRVAIDGKQHMYRLNLLKTKPEYLGEVTSFVNSKATHFSGTCFSHMNFVHYNLCRYTHQQFLHILCKRGGKKSSLIVHIIS